MTQYELYIDSLSLQFNSCFVTARSSLYSSSDQSQNESDDSRNQNYI